MSLLCTRVTLCTCSLVAVVSMEQVTERCGSWMLLSWSTVDLDTWIWILRFGSQFIVWTKASAKWICVNRNAKKKRWKKDCGFNKLALIAHLWWNSTSGVLHKTPQATQQQKNSINNACMAFEDTFLLINSKHGTHHLCLNTFSVSKQNSFGFSLTTMSFGVYPVGLNRF